MSGRVDGLLGLPLALAAGLLPGRQVTAVVRALLADRGKRLCRVREVDVGRQVVNGRRGGQFENVEGRPPPGERPLGLNSGSSGRIRTCNRPVNQLAEGSPQRR